MPASRNCTRCGATLSATLRWCGQCYEPVREFTPRAPIHRGDFVDAPRVTSNLSRWQASETTFGPVGRVVATAFLGFLVVGGAWFTMSSPMFVVALIPGTSLIIWALRDIWRPVRTDLQPYRSPGVRVEDVATALRPPSVHDIPARRRAWIVVAAVAYAGVVVLYFRLPGDVQMVFVGLLAVGCVAGVLWRIVSR